jgi:hypothetical protein
MKVMVPLRLYQVQKICDGGDGSFEILFSFKVKVVMVFLKVYPIQKIKVVVFLRVCPIQKMKVVVMVMVFLKVYPIKKMKVIMACPLEGLEPMMVCQNDLYKFIGEVQVHDDLLLGLLIFMRL